MSSNFGFRTFRRQYFSTSQPLTFGITSVYNNNSAPLILIVRSRVFRTRICNTLTNFIKTRLLNRSVACFLVVFISDPDINTTCKYVKLFIIYSFDCMQINLTPSLLRLPRTYNIEWRSITFRSPLAPLKKGGNRS